jgi:hypothetical protein
MAKQMLKRKDGSYSQRGLWDNIRANKGSGKKPTAEMLKQEKKIKAGKAQRGGSMTDSTAYYTKEAKDRAAIAVLNAQRGYRKAAEDNMAKARKAYSDASRQQFKGKPGFDKMGNPIKKTGGSIKSQSKKK